jgi:hypothetical protein
VLSIALALLLNRFYLPFLDTTPQPFTSSILALEFAGSLADVRALFVGHDDAIDSFHRGHFVDMLFLVAYGAMLFFANHGAWLWHKRRIYLVGAALALLAGLADCSENLLLMQLQDALQAGGNAPDFSQLRLFVAGKFIAIALAMVCLLPALWPRGVVGKCYAAAVAVAVPATLLTVSGWFNFASAMLLATAVAWLSLWVFMLVITRKMRTHVKAN